jgi:hypothetical protein
MLVIAHALIERYHRNDEPAPLEFGDWVMVTLEFLTVLEKLRVGTVEMLPEGHRSRAEQRRQLHSNESELRVLNYGNYREVFCRCNEPHEGDLKLIDTFMSDYLASTYARKVSEKLWLYLRYPSLIASASL